MTIAEIWRRGQVGWPRSFPIAQVPNAPLLLAIAARQLERAEASAVRRPGQVASAAGIAVWAWRETTGGSNWLRRLLGVAALVSLGARLLRTLGRCVSRRGEGAQRGGAGCRAAADAPS